MGALAPISPWIPEDDVLLRNAVEAGASLESLAKGAVEFSRQFSFQELQERWVSLLYDPIVSEKASACMIEFERSSSLPFKSSKFEASKNNKYFFGKRKVESVRSCYYSMRKRFCEGPLDPVDTSFLLGPSDATCHDIGSEHLLPNYVPGDSNPNYFELEPLSMGMMHHPFSEVMIGGAADKCMGEPPTFLLPDDDNVENMGVCGYDIEPPDGQCHEFQRCESKRILEEISHSLLTDDNSLGFLDVAGEVAVDQFFAEDLDSLLPDSPRDIHQDNIQNITESISRLDSNPSVANDMESSPSVEGQITCKEKILMPSSTSSLDSQFPEMRNGVICCTLNTEDPDIPCNDDILLPNDVPSSSNPFMAHNLCDANRLSSSFVKDFSGNCNPGGNASSQHEILGQPHTVGSHFGEEKNIHSKFKVPHAEQRSNDFATEENLNYPSTSGQEEQFVESDDDIPYYSDVEAMILDMDLCPGPDEQVNSNVIRFQDKDAKRDIIRLEQVARSYMNRAIASHGAFAVLYGRHSKHYISKPEVLLGRSTGDSTVDIDLGREGRANKVSRQQAIISMERDGTFSMKNVGRRSIFMNNQEVVTSQSVRLHSGCLIQIRALAFIFEFSQACMKRAVEDFFREGQPQQNGV